VVLREWRAWLAAPTNAEEGQGVQTAHVLGRGSDERTPHH